MKVYFWVVLIISLFNFYYQTIVYKFGISQILDLIFLVILLLAFYSYVFGKKIFDLKTWKLLFYIATGYLIYIFAKNLYEGSIYTSFGLQDLLIGLIGYTILFGPAYLALNNLSSAKISKKKR